MTTRKRKPPQSLYVIVDTFRPMLWSFVAYESERQAEQVARYCNNDNEGTNTYVVVRYVRQRKPK